VGLKKKKPSMASGFVETQNSIDFLKVQNTKTLLKNQKKNKNKNKKKKKKARLKTKA
jgi:hypothetical protein